MLLRLSIEIKTVQGRCPTATLSWNNNTLVVLETGSVEIDVQECDTVTLTMSGKNKHDTVVVNDEIVEDMAVVLTGMWLGDVNFTNQLDHLLCFDDQNTAIPSNPYMSRNGCIKISISQLVVSDFDYSEIRYMSFEEMAEEVLGRPTTLTSFD